ncbi:NifU family protein [Streptomyces marokkonensis]|uniref:NifU family protein n=1 Tax=Streptomyces marokkonensis TaxID=324855 RepID=A0ABW6Q011_9ACTN
MIPLHPQPVPGHPDRLRWIVPAGVLTWTGAPASVPAPLAVLLADGTLAHIAVEPAVVVMRLGEGHSWRADGSRVRTALHKALEDPAGWSPAADAGAGRSRDDTSLHTAARNLIAGPVGERARSHGGAIELVGVHDGVVTVRLGGSCHGCPAAWLTLHQWLERLLRRQCPQLVEVRQAGPGRPRFTGR